mmetsp:Transcript_47734/g.153655  ORF Transcript_47734/g.153655 Transcript_47734/m.153655 type:complete len:239 (-) Transcript_47734:1702-2418(-)
MHPLRSTTRKRRSSSWMETSEGQQSLTFLASSTSPSCDTFIRNHSSPITHPSWQLLGPLLPATRVISLVSASILRTAALAVSTINQKAPVWETRTASGRKRSAAQQVGHANSKVPLAMFKISSAPVIKESTDQESMRKVGSAISNSVVPKAAMPAGIKLVKLAMSTPRWLHASSLIWAATLHSGLNFSFFSSVCCLSDKTAQSASARDGAANCIRDTVTTSFELITCSSKWPATTTFA